MTNSEPSLLDYLEEQQATDKEDNSPKNTQKNSKSEAKKASANDGLAARAAALNHLRNVLNRKQTLDESLEREQAFLGLPARDKAFCRMLTATTLRRLGQIDDLIRACETRPSTRPPVLDNILRIGITQILFMDVPDHAAVDTSVRLTEENGLSGKKAFVNGVLRTITRSGHDMMMKQDDVRLNTPDWLLKTWIDDYGLRIAAEIARANITEAPLDITLKDINDIKYWEGALDASAIGAQGSIRRMSGGAVVDLEGFNDGRWWVQDAAAALPAALFGETLHGKTIIDLCAAPGGKTMQLAARGANVIALDRSASRMKRLEENLKRTGLSARVNIAVADAAQWHPPEGAPNFILLDAPCSATGTIRRHPDVPHLKSEQDIKRLNTVQTNILNNAFEILAPGGTLIYCTCSLQKSEGEAQIIRLLSNRHDAYKQAISAPEIGGIKEAITEDGDVRMLPHYQAARGGMDGFYIARIKKTN